jgi:hypothetical protein
VDRQIDEMGIFGMVFQNIQYVVVFLQTDTERRRETDTERSRQKDGPVYRQRDS